MHRYIVNASIQILPIVQDRHPYEWVDEAIAIIQNAGIKYEIGPFATVVEGKYEEVMNLINAIRHSLRAPGSGKATDSLRTLKRHRRHFSASGNAQVDENVHRPSRMDGIRPSSAAAPST